MWLDRRSGQPPSPSPPPLGRRTSHLASRPGFSPRTSSLVSLTSQNESTSSLPRRANGSALKQSVTSGPEPLEVLRAVLATEKSQPFDASLAYDFDGLSLRELVDAGTPSDMHHDPAQSVEDYERDTAKLEELHRSIRACDDVLSSVESNLTSFKNDLEAVSAEIETLQARSTALNARLANRKTVEKALGPVVEEMSIAPAVVRKIADGAIDEAWVKALSDVERRLRSMDAKAKERKHVKGITDLKPLLENLTNKALERIRDYLVAQIKALRSPNINAQIIQQQCFVKYKDLYAFLAKHHATLGDELGQAYLNTMRWYYLHQFTRYLKSLESVKVHAMDKHDLLGNEDTSRKSLLSSKPSAAYDAFNLGRRGDLLSASHQAAVPSYLADDDQTTHYLEYPFRNFHLALVDNASAEYSFLTSFFAPTVSYAGISRYFNYIFEPTFALGDGLTKSLVSDSVDCLGVLLCVRLNQSFAFELQRRKIPAVDAYINRTSMRLWPRFQQVMDLHLESLRRAGPASLAAATSSLWGGGGSAATPDAKQSAAPHFLTQRFAQFLHGVLALSTTAGDDEPVSSSLARLRAELPAVLARLAKPITDARKRERFLYNNYSLVLTIIGDVEGKLAADQRAWFEEARDQVGAGGR